MTRNDRIVVYCSGPLFSPEERAAMASISHILQESGYETFLPHRDGLEALVLPLADRSTIAGTIGQIIGQRVHKAIFAVDVYQIVERCDALVFNMNGRVPDEGGVAEAAIAFATGKPVVIYKSDPRRLLGGQDNSMVLGLSHRYTAIDDVVDVAGAVEAALSDDFGSADTADETVLPASVREVVDRGRRIWKLLRALQRTGAKPDEYVEQLETLLKKELADS